MKKILSFAFLIVASGCGIKGDPLPPAEQETIQSAQEIKAETPAIDQNSKKPSTKKK